VFFHLVSARVGFTSSLHYIPLTAFSLSIGSDKSDYRAQQSTWALCLALRCTDLHFDAELVGAATHASSSSSSSSSSSFSSSSSPSATSALSAEVIQLAERLAAMRSVSDAREAADFCQFRTRTIAASKDLSRAVVHILCSFAKYLHLQTPIL
jgi:hypothetical protein